MRTLNILWQALGFLTLLATAASAAPADEFTSAVKAHGDNYRLARDQFLVEPGAAEFIASKLTARDGNERLAARILKGWLENAKAYHALLAARQIIQRNGDQHREWALHPDGIGPEAVPLMYELLVKATIEGGSSDAARRVVNLARQKEANEVPLDLASLHDFYQQGEFVSQPQRLDIAWLLGNLPLAYQQDREQDLLRSLQAELARKEPSSAATSSLLLGLARSTQSMQAADRDAIVDTLLQQKNLAGVLSGEAHLTHAIGNIGGDRAVAEVVRYLEGKASDNVLEQRRALVALSRSGSNRGTEKLLQYSEHEQLALRDEAIKGLAFVPFTPAVGDKLAALAAADNLPQRTQLHAMRSLTQILEKNRNNPAIANDLKKTLQTVSGKKPNLKQEIEDAIKALDE